MKRYLPLALLALSACDDPIATDCAARTTALVSATSVQVTVVDSIDGTSRVPGARGRWISGTATDTLRTWDLGLLAIGPAGRYALAIEAPGYQPWARSDVQVRPGECGVVTTQVTARMVRDLPPTPFTRAGTGD